MTTITEAAERQAAGRDAGAPQLTEPKEAQC